MFRHRQLNLVLLLCCALLSRSLAAQSPRSGDRAALSGLKETVAPKIEMRALPFNLNNVRLLDGPFKDAQERDRAYLHSLDSDRLLHMFRVTAGLSSDSTPYGGWESAGVELRGHTLGHYLSACALMVASTGDEVLKAKADAIVAELAKVQAALPAHGANPGYLAAFPESFFDRVDHLQPVWAPYYTLHKLMAGLLDMYLYCDNDQALQVLNRMADWIKFRTERLTDEQRQAVLNVEFGGMNEVLANLYAVTGNPMHLEIARRFDHRAVFDPLARHEDRLTGLHVNTQVPKMIGAAREYEMTGETRYRDIASFFFDQVTGHRMYAFGGTSNYEVWRTPPDRLADQLSPETAEMCCTYNMLKLTRHLFEWNPDARYADYYERALFNHILASQDPATGMVMYYTAMNPGHWKVYSTPDNSFWCCVGTGIENHAKYGDSIYFHDDNSLYVNLFIASELTWTSRGLKLRQQTKFPEQQSTTLIFEPSSPTRLTLRIRVPYWARAGVGVAVNGSAAAVRAEPSGYVTIDRTWRSGDRVEVGLPMNLHPAQMPDNPRLAAIMVGPIMLAGGLGAEVWNRELQYAGDQRARDGAAPYSNPLLAMVAEPNDLDAALEPVAGEPLTFRTRGAGRPDPFTLVPYYKMTAQRYNVYWPLLTSQQYDTRVAEHKAELERQRAAAEAHRRMLEARRLDSVVIGNAESERAHMLATERSTTGPWSERIYRDANNGGYFSYRLRVDPGSPAELLCTYWGGDASRTFNIWIDGTDLGAFTIPQGRGEVFFEQSHSIPLAATRGKQSVTVKFAAPNPGMAGGIYDLHMLRSNVIDRVEVGDAASEQAHSLKPTDSSSGPFNGRTYRDAHDGGSFAYSLAVDPARPMALRVTYWGGDAGRTFTITVDDGSLGTFTIPAGHPEQFFEFDHAIPPALTRDKQRVTVTFRAPKPGSAGGIFALQMVRASD